MNSNELYDIYETWHVPFWRTTWFYTIIGVCITFIILGIGVLLFFWYKRRPKKLIMPWEHALMMLASLHPEIVSSKEDAKKFYSKLTNILKVYVQERYAILAMSATDSEFIAHIERASLVPSDLIDGLKELMNGAAAVKFADMAAMQEQMKVHVHLCKECVEKTIPEKGVTYK